jgi:two-component system CheB/CheR fusion protein
LSRNPENFAVVGIGASAGGIEALEGFFRGVPPDPGAGFVVVTHLNPERESILHEIISRYTAMTVQIAADGAQVQPNCVYVLPSDAILSIQGGRLEIKRLEPQERERKPIDIFLSSLAKDVGEAAVSVVLSGGDSDGTLGTKAVKERGGLTLAQISNGSGPAHPSMPDSAISTGFVDFAIPADEMGAKIAQFARSLDMMEAMAAKAGKGDGESAEARARNEICAILRNQIGHDFSGYKPKTFTRRVQRRMQVLQADTMDAYVECLRQDPKEVGRLFRDLLINVTNFFRDADAFEKLSEVVIPKLFEGRGANDTVRVWVPGCATGEEVFSIAILMREHMDTLIAVPRVQIFATDIDEHALSVARAARYPEALLDMVTPERRERFFVPNGGSYVLNKAVRDLCIFSPHSVIRDPPFSRLDLISCRNLLIYFGADAQEKVIPIFHYSLKPGGYLFLGTSENVSQFGEMFTPLEKKHRIFRSREDSIVPARVPMVLGGFRAAPPSPKAGGRRSALSGAALRQAVEVQVLEHFAPAFVVADRDGEVVYFSARTGKYIEPATGLPTRQLLTMARRGLRLDLRTVLRDAVENQRRVVREHLAVEGDDGRVQLVTLTVEPVADRDADDLLFIVLFTDEGPSLSREDAISRPQLSAPGEVALLERELRDTRERLQSLIEEYETALEELKSSNEELVSVNEELQSTNEELEASKEELQSLNEELQTVNAELNTKIEALDRANNDLQNLFESSEIATVFLDKDLVIRSFTPAVSQVFNILPGDRGRPLTDLSSRLPLPRLADEIRSVFDTGKVVEHRIEADGGERQYLVRLLPYRDFERSTRGVIATFIDVTALSKVQAHQQVLIAELNHRVKNMLSVVLAIAAQTIKGAASLDTFKAAYIPRVLAMARSYELLSRESWVSASMREIIRQELEPFGADRVLVGGPVVLLKPEQAMSLGMVLHELATNAAKYGALSTPQGTVQIGWSFADGKPDTLFMRWRERGGPAVEKPKKKGFGLKLVAGEATHRLGGEPAIEFAPEGLSASLTIRLE